MITSVMSKIFKFYKISKFFVNYRDLDCAKMNVFLSLERVLYQCHTSKVQHLFHTCIHRH
jgi:hypothetical protein